MKIYQGQRPADDDIGDCRVVVIEGGSVRPLHHTKYHSDAFEWSYAGSGPADTALSILADFFGERPTRRQLARGQSRSWQLHQHFKRDFIALAPHDGFTVTSEQIEAWLKTLGLPENKEEQL